ncbi:hypothetical protein B0T11DRAFT_273404 [Plectosphaerella cucumerina]|uniref:Uncharacterized protein n=1 Tax=Plectosphaerella cucumerina TaxID=40658 RepID=A0A8K0TUH7_9PEZI|nr:hypothetical protein B0T11DRAFT_273404 [Plectosphaerella cucumerina]
MPTDTLRARHLLVQLVSWVIRHQVLGSERPSIWRIVSPLRVVHEVLTEIVNKTSRQARGSTGGWDHTEQHVEAKSNCSSQRLCADMDTGSSLSAAVPPHPAHANRGNFFVQPRSTTSFYRTLRACRTDRRQRR